MYLGVVLTRTLLAHENARCRQIIMLRKVHQRYTQIPLDFNKIIDVHKRQFYVAPSKSNKMIWLQKDLRTMT